MAFHSQVRYSRTVALKFVFADCQPTHLVRQFTCFLLLCRRDLFKSLILLDLRLFAYFLLLLQLVLHSKHFLLARQRCFILHSLFNYVSSVLLIPSCTLKTPHRQANGHVDSQSCRYQIALYSTWDHVCGDICVNVDFECCSAGSLFLDYSGWRCWYWPD